MPTGGGGCPSKNPQWSPSTPRRAPSGTSSPLATRDHPRMCGEQGEMHTAVWQRLESPPPRGTVDPGGDGQVVLGIIPACAGSSNLGKRIVNLFRDHPRACGEQLVCCRIVTKGEGSSPRMRGAVCRGLCRAVRVGIIPACAGSRYKSRNQRGRIRDHPRVCEEQLIKSKVNAGNQGSSPRVRGAALRALFWSLGRGIIPACAGSSVNVVEPAAEQGGSSPRVRGAVMPSSSAICWNGIIPACAGSSGSPTLG